MERPRTDRTEKHYYPTPVSGRQGLLFSLLFGSFVSLFLWFFQPFNINIQAYSVAELVLFGAISFGSFAIAHNLLPLLYPKIYQEHHWTIYHQLLFYGILLFAIATFNGLYINFRNDLDFGWSNYLLIITQTFAVGMLPISLSVVFSYYWKYKKIVEQSQYLNEQIQQIEPLAPRQYPIQSKLKSETLVIDETTFLFAKSDGNYIEVHVRGESPGLLRMGLLDLEKQLADSSHLLRCHRSYLVNTKRIVRATGNAQGLQLWFADYPGHVPVSRKYLSRIRAVFGN